MKTFSTFFVKIRFSKYFQTAKRWKRNFRWNQVWFGGYEKNHHRENIWKIRGKRRTFGRSWRYWKCFLKFLKIQNIYLEQADKLKKEAKKFQKTAQKIEHKEEINASCWPTGRRYWVAVRFLEHFWNLENFFKLMTRSD